MTGPINRKFKATLIRLEDYFRVNNYSALAALGKIPTALWSSNLNKGLSASTSLALYYSRSLLGQSFLSRAKRQASKLAKRANRRGNVSIMRSAMIKPYVSPNEPGLLVVSFEHELAKMILLERFRALESEYRIIFLPTWQPFYSEAICLLDALATKPYFVMPSALSEASLCTAFSQKARFLPFHAASWVRHSAYQQPAKEKDIDILMIANFSRYKRHWRLFEALQHLPRNLRAVVAGVPLGIRTKASLLNDARIFGVDDRIEVVERASDEQLRSLLRRSRMFCAMTHKEGAYIAVAEALMAGVPVVMFADAVVGTKAYVTEETGVLLSPELPLAEQLAKALVSVRNLDTRAWAKDRISAEANCVRLNALMRQTAADDGASWTRDIEPFYCEHFLFKYFDASAEAAAAPEYARIESQFGLTIERH